LCFVVVCVVCGLRVQIGGPSAVVVVEVGGWGAKLSYTIY